MHIIIHIPEENDFTLWKKLRHLKKLEEIVGKGDVSGDSIRIAPNDEGHRHNLEQLYESMGRWQVLERVPQRNLGPLN